MAHKKFIWTFRWILFLPIILTSFLNVAEGTEETDDTYINKRKLILEYFLPINSLDGRETARAIEKRDVEGSGDDTALNEMNTESEWNEKENSTPNTMVRSAEKIRTKNNESDFEGSGEIAGESETLGSDTRLLPIIGDSEIVTTTTEVPYEENDNRSLSQFIATGTAEIITEVPDSPTIYEELQTTKDANNTVELLVSLEMATSATTTKEPQTANLEVVMTKSEFVTVIPTTTLEDNEPTPDNGTLIQPQSSRPEFTTIHRDIMTSSPYNVAIHSDTHRPVPTEEPVTPIVLTESTTAPEGDNATLGKLIPELSLTSPKPVVNEIFSETKLAQKTLEASPGNILQKKNMTMVDPLLIVRNTEIVESEGTVQMNSEEPRRLGAYIVIGLILLSFSTLVGYIIFRKRMNRKRENSEENQECLDTEKALLSLSDYKDSSEMEENHLKNNEITPIVVKSNSQINKFEKNTNFSSPKNLNTIANEKNIEKDNVLKSTTENLTQVIIEDSPKDDEEVKNSTAMEKLIVKTRIDQDSIPKRPVIINRSSTGYLPIPQENS